MQDTLFLAFTCCTVLPPACCHHTKGTPLGLAAIFLIIHALRLLAGMVPEELQTVVSGKQRQSVAQKQQCTGRQAGCHFVAKSER